MGEWLPCCGAWKIPGHAVLIIFKRWSIWFGLKATQTECSSPVDKISIVMEIDFKILASGFGGPSGGLLHTGKHVWRCLFHIPWRVNIPCWFILCTVLVITIDLLTTGVKGLLCTNMLGKYILQMTKKSTWKAAVVWLWFKGQAAAV